MSWLNGDERTLARHQKRDAELGTPTKETLNERAKHAALKGQWKTAIAAVRQGADPGTVSKRDVGEWDSEHYPLIFRAVQDGNAEAVKELLQLGASRFAKGTYIDFATHIQMSLPFIAAKEGTAEVLHVILEAGTGGLQKEINDALAEAASRKRKIEMVKDLLAHGANNFDEALRAAEKANNADAVRLIRAREAELRGQPRQGVAEDRRVREIGEVLENADARDRRNILAALQKKFPADFAAVAPRPPAPVVVTPKPQPQETVQPKPAVVVKKEPPAPAKTPHRKLNL